MSALFEILDQLMPKEPKRLHVKTVAAWVGKHYPSVNVLSLQSNIMYRWMHARWGGLYTSKTAEQAEWSPYTKEESGTAAQAGEPIAKPLPLPAPKPVAQPFELVHADREVAKWKRKAKDAEGKYKEIVKLNEVLEDRFEAIACLEQHTQRIVTPIFAETESNRNQAVAVLPLTDTHFGTTVKASMVHGYNAYNPDIARERMERWARNAKSLIHLHRTRVDIPEILLWLGGDFITGFIHQELRQTNSMSPTEEVEFAIEELKKAILFLAQQSGCKRIRIVCNVGNHGRIDEKLGSSTLLTNSYEMLMYSQLYIWIKEVQGLSDVVEMHLPQGLVTYIQVYGFTHRFAHGHNLKYNGGIGGLAIPLAKWLKAENETRYADFTTIGHFHTYFEPFAGVHVNGSMVGYDAYARGFSAKPCPPVQAFYMIDSKRGVVNKTPIFCD
jgi:hypothetical protein